MGNRERLQIDDRIGTEDLEHGMRAGRVRDVAVIMAIVVGMLAAFNSGGLVKWTQALPSNAATAWIAEQADGWHRIMLRWGPASYFEAWRDKVRRD